jgi:hypothetical protein
MFTTFLHIQHSKKKKKGLFQNMNKSLVWWYAPVIPATLEMEARGWSEPSLRSAWPTLQEAISNKQ